MIYFVNLDIIKWYIIYYDKSSWKIEQKALAETFVMATLLYGTAHSYFSKQRCHCYKLHCNTLLIFYVDERSVTELRTD